MGKDQDETSLTGKEDGVDEDTSTHSEAGVELIRGESSETTGKEVHPSKDRGNGGGRLGSLFELLLEVKCGGVVHGELDTEAASVLDEENPRVEVESSAAEGSGGRNLGHGSVLLHLAVVSLWCVITDKVNSDTGGKSDNGRDDRDSTPGPLGIVVVKDLEERKEEGSHDELGDSTSEVTPSTDQSVGGSNNVLGEHTGGPVLAHDKSTSSNSNEKTKDGESFSGVDQSGAGGRDGCTAKNDGKEDTGSVLVASRSESETHKDGSSDTDNGRSPDLFLGQAESLLDFGEKRSNGEPNEKGDKERPPRAVEGTHVGTGEVAELDFLGLVILVRIDLQDISLVLLDFLRLKRERVSDPCTHRGKAEAHKTLTAPLSTSDILKFFQSSVL